MEFKDYYQALGVARDASADDIKRAYRKLARQFHPDINKAAGAEARFKEIGEAHDVLKDPEKRAAYDQVGAGFKAGQEFRPPPGWDAGFEHGRIFLRDRCPGGQRFLRGVVRPRRTARARRPGWICQRSRRDSARDSRPRVSKHAAATTRPKCWSISRMPTAAPPGPSRWRGRTGQGWPPAYARAHAQCENPRGRAPGPADPSCGSGRSRHRRRSFGRSLSRDRIQSAFLLSGGGRRCLS